MVVFLSGCITGIPDYKYEFRQAEAFLSQQGHVVLNPAVLPAGLQHEDYMRISCAMLRVCDAVYMLSGWEYSVGATEEHTLAQALGLEIWYEEQDTACIYEKGAQPDRPERYFA